MSDGDERSGSIDRVDEEEEALHLKRSAEEKYNSGDLNSALEYANRAHKLNPSTKGLPELLTNLKIIAAATAAEKETPDYYGILQVERFSHINLIKKRYRRLALTLHPDKNPHVASEEAFKWVGEAARVLSDKTRRREYDTKLRIALQSKASQEEAELGENFSTACSSCGLLHQFERKYLGHNLMCPKCRNTFKAMDEGAEGGQTRVSARIQEKVAKGGHMGIVERLGLGVKRRNTSVGEVSEGKARKSDDSSSKRAEDSEEESMTLLQMKMLMKKKKARKETEVEEVGIGREQELEKENVREEEEKEKVNLRGKRNRKGVSKDKKMGAVNDLHSDIVECRSSKKGKEDGKEKEKVIENTTGKRERRRTSKYGYLNDEKTNTSKIHTDSEIESRISSEKGSLEIVPLKTTDFYDFDKDRREKSFKKGQVWAVYDDDDGMPKHYGLIDRVVSINPFKVIFIWLRFQSNRDDELLSWPNTGFHVSCGIFQLSRKVTIKYLNIFSHLVNFERTAKELYRIYPKKGSVWAMYNSNNAPQVEQINQGDKDTRCYDIVVCLTNYSDIHGLSVAYLEKVQEFKSVYKRSAVGASAVIYVGPKDVRLLSHEIHANKLSGKESSNLPKDCWELDPASLTPRLIIAA
ncbi:hypothetical protein ACS0TY_022301 [Phlomoides rotata]